MRRYLKESHPVYKRIIECEQYLLDKGISIHGGTVYLTDEESNLSLTIGDNIFNSDVFPRCVEEMFYIVDE